MKMTTKSYAFREACMVVFCFFTIQLLFGCQNSSTSCATDYDCLADEVCIDGTCSHKALPKTLPPSCFDMDKDGFYTVGCGTLVDCDDKNPAIKPTAKEKCDSIDNDCDKLIDEDYVCGSNVPPVSVSKEGNYAFKSGLTNDEGKIFFKDDQTGKSVTILVRNSSGKALKGARVLFFDGYGFEGFQAQATGYSAVFRLFDHNSTHTLSLTPSPWAFHKLDGSQNSASLTTGGNFSTWAKKTWKYYGCVTAKQAEFARDRVTYILKYSEKVPGIGAAVIIVNKIYSARDKITQLLINFGILKGGECAAYHRYGFIPGNSIPTGGIVFTECIEKTEDEVCNQIDDDCDGVADEGDVCKCLPKQNNRACHNGDIWWFDSCAKPYKLYLSCSSNEYCSGGKCISKGTSCQNQCSTQGARQCNGNGWQICGDFDSDSCLEWSSVTACSSTHQCVMGQCKPKTGTCQNKCTNGMLSCGLLDVVMECKDSNGDGCTEWTTKMQCPSSTQCANGKCVSKSSKCMYQIVHDGDPKKCSMGCDFYHQIANCTQIECSTYCKSHSDCPAGLGFYCWNGGCTTEILWCKDCCKHTGKSKSNIKDSKTGLICGEVCQ